MIITREWAGLWEIIYTGSKRANHQRRYHFYRFRRPAVNSEIDGLSGDIDYLTNETVLELETLPPHIAIIGGGYIAAEYGHFFSALGAKVTIIQNQNRLIPHEEPEISERLRVELQKRMEHLF